MPFKRPDTSMSLEAGTSQGKKSKKKDYQPKHAKPKLCTHSWSTPRPPGMPATGHYDHACGNANAGKGSGSECSGRHVCRDFRCHETH